MAEADARRRAWLEKAERFLRTAQQAFRDGDAESAVSRSYYSFLSSTVLLPGLEDVENVKSHIEVIRRVVQWNRRHTRLNQAGLLAGHKDLRGSLMDLHRLREQADYRVGLTSMGMAQNALEFVTRFLATVKETVS